MAISTKRQFLILSMVGIKELETCLLSILQGHRCEKDSDKDATQPGKQLTYHTVAFPLPCGGLSVIAHSPTIEMFAIAHSSQSHVPMQCIRRCDNTSSKRVETIRHLLDEVSQKCASSVLASLRTHNDNSLRSSFNAP